MRQYGRSAPAAGAFRVLVVEESGLAALAMRRRLEEWGHQVAVVYSGPDGLRLAMEFRPAVMLCNLEMPGMDGYEVATRMQGDPALKRIQFIALTAYAEKVEARRCLKAGLERRILKPIDFEELRRLLSDQTA